VNHLREALNAVPLEEPVPAEVFAPYDVPVIAGAVKLWLLELDPPLALWEGWDDIRKIYPVVGAAAKSESGDAEAQRITDLGTALLTALQRSPKVLDLNNAVNDIQNPGFTRLRSQTGKLPGRRGQGKRRRGRVLPQREQGGETDLVLYAESDRGAARVNSGVVQPLPIHPVPSLPFPSPSYPH
jgi:hypothetical protein